MSKLEWKEKDGRYSADSKASDNRGVFVWSVHRDRNVRAFILVYSSMELRCIVPKLGTQTFEKVLYRKI